MLAKSLGSTAVSQVLNLPSDDSLLPKIRVEWNIHTPKLFRQLTTAAQSNSKLIHGTNENGDTCSLENEMLVERLVYESLPYSLFMQAREIER